VAYATHNPSLPFVDASWKGNSLDANGKYRNLGRRSERTFREVMRWQWGERPQKNAKASDTWRPTVVNDTSFLQNSDDTLVWLGHATFFIRLNGVSILTDPVFGSVGPVRRQTPFPIDPTLIRGIDYVIVSHNHRDHCDKQSFQQVMRQNPGAKVLTGLRLSTLLSSWWNRSVIEEAGWYQHYRTHPGVEVIYLPAMHWARRGAFDLNTMLWGSVLIRSANTTVYFGADSGYDTHFSSIGAQFGGIDIALLGIGAYSPSWFMHTSHTSPAEALKAAEDLKARNFVPMHYGTFDLSDEPFGEPYRLVSEMQSANTSIRLLQPGEVWKL
jgi:L-ascorbate metabolism protein UlaG (beta-lactamase superfamily)